MTREFRNKLSSYIWIKLSVNLEYGSDTKEYEYVFWRGSVS